MKASCRTRVFLLGKRVVHGHACNGCSAWACTWNGSREDFNGKDFPEKRRAIVCSHSPAHKRDEGRGVVHVAAWMHEDVSWGFEGLTLAGQQPKALASTWPLGWCRHQQQSRTRSRSPWHCPVRGGTVTKSQLPLITADSNKVQVRPHKITAHLDFDC